MTRVSRRSFLKCASAAAAAPYVITSTALGNADTPPASDRITLGHIGVGGRGTDLLRGFLQCKDCQSVAAADAYASRRNNAAAMMKGKAYADFREVLARDDIDAVVVATPDHWHVKLAILAARAGKDAYVEKPLGVSIEEDLLCQQTFTEKKRIFQYGTQQRSMSHCHFGCELVRSGKIGQLKRIEVIAPNGEPGGSTTEAPVPPDLDLNMWIGPAPMKPYTPDRCKAPGTYFIYDYSIGYLGGWGAHPLDIMVFGCDADLSGNIEIEGTGVIPKEGLYDTVYNWDIKGKLGNVEFSFLPGSDSTRFIGTEGWIQVRRGGIEAEPASLLQTKLDTQNLHLLQSARQDQNFIDSIKSRKPAISPVDHAVRSDVISLLCDIAVRTGRKITWDWKKAEIVGDPEAAKLAKMRPMREPWKI
jgi:hypothetical protein